jgi:hypothetical protein
VPVSPAYSVRAVRPGSWYPERPSTLKRPGPGRRTAARQVAWWHRRRKTVNNPTAATRSHFLRLRIRPASRDIPTPPDISPPACWLIGQWPRGAVVIASDSVVASGT